MTVEELIYELKTMPRKAEVSIAIDDIRDRCDVDSVIGLIHKEKTEVLICETRMWSW